MLNLEGYDKVAAWANLQDAAVKLVSNTATNDAFLKMAYSSIKDVDETLIISLMDAKMDTLKGLYKLNAIDHLQDDKIDIVLEGVWNFLTYLIAYRTEHKTE